MSCLYKPESLQSFNGLSVAKGWILNASYTKTLSLPIQVSYLNKIFLTVLEQKVALSAFVKKSQFKSWIKKKGAHDKALISDYCLERSEHSPQITNFIFIKEVTFVKKTFSARITQRTSNLMICLHL